MKRILFIIFTIALATTARAQLVFSPDSYDFGSIRETDGAVSHTFTATNSGKNPVVILDAVTTCGCTVPIFSQKPVAAGGKTQITVTYDPTDRPGEFSKDVAVYTSESDKPVKLTIRGTVIPRPKTIEEQYAVDAGGGLRLDHNECVAGYLQQGKSVQFAVGYINHSTRPITLALQPQSPSGLLLTTAPGRIAAGARGEINLMYRIPDDKPYYGMLRDTLAISVNGHPTDTYIIAHAIGIDRPSTSAGSLQCSESIIRFGEVKHDALTQKQTFTLTNTGAGSLIVRAVELSGELYTTIHAGQHISAGGSLTAEVTLDPAAQDYGTLSERLTIITNDPAHPMQQLRVVAIIEK